MVKDAQSSKVCWLTKEDYESIKEMYSLTEVVEEELLKTNKWLDLTCSEYEIFYIGDHTHSRNTLIYRGYVKASQGKTKVFFSFHVKGTNSENIAAEAIARITKRAISHDGGILPEKLRESGNRAKAERYISKTFKSIPNTILDQVWDL